MVSSKLAEPKAVATRALRGEAALLLLVDVLIGPAARRKDNSWLLRLRIRPPSQGTETSLGIRSWTGDVERVLTEVLEGAEAGANISADTLREREVPEGWDNRTRDEQAVGALTATMDLRELYATGGRLFEDVRDLPKSVHGTIRLDVGHYRRARSFALEHLRHALFPPALVLERGWVWTLVFPLRRPIFLCPQTSELSWRAAEALARSIFCASPDAVGGVLDVTDLLVERAVRVPLRLLPIAPGLRHDAEQVIKRDMGLRRELELLYPAAKPAPQGPPPPAMSLPTLPPAWDFTDLALTPTERQVLAGQPNARGLWRMDGLVGLVEELARRGHGWPDVERLLDDPRCGVSTLLRVRQGSQRGLKQRFRKALVDRDLRDPPRLPWGIKTVTRLSGGEPDEPVRYVVRGRNAAQTYTLEVPWDVLRSAAKLKNAVSRHLEAPAPPLSQRVWDAVLGLVLHDPRVFRRRRSARKDTPPPLSHGIQAFLRRGGPYFSESAGLDPSVEDGWPIVRDGAAEFPLGVLLRVLRRERPEAEISRAEVAQAVRSLGGGPRGHAEFGQP